MTLEQAKNLKFGQVLEHESEQPCIIETCDSRASAERFIKAVFSRRNTGNTGAKHDSH